MTSYRAWLGVVWLASGCWQDERPIDGTFTRDEWTFLSTEFRLPAPATCPSPNLPPGDPARRLSDRVLCDQAATLGHRLFFDASLSGPINIHDPDAPGAFGETGKVSCSSCHDSSHPKDSNGKLLTDANGNLLPRRYYTDVRSNPNNVSAGAKVTKHNAMGLINSSYKIALTTDSCPPDEDPTGHLCRSVFSWTGGYGTPGGIMALAGKGAMQSNGIIMSQALRKNPKTFADYLRVFQGFPPSCRIDDKGTEDPADDVLVCECTPAEMPCHTTDQVFDNVGLALEMYIRRLDSVDTAFDRYVAGTVCEYEYDSCGGNTTHQNELTDQERRGLAVFIGKGMCVECHRGPLLSDLQFHNTGVPQIGARVPAVDGGLGDEMNQGKPASGLGAFLTPPLRNVAKTGPYMHAGQFATLHEVVDFYRKGGVTDGFSGVRDPRIQPLEIDDDEAADLEAFLGTLTAPELPSDLADPLP